MGPAEEEAHRVAFGAFADESVDVDLGEAGKGQCLGVEPGKEYCGATDGDMDSCGARGSETSAGGASAGLSQDRPLGVNLQRVAV